MDVTRDSLLIIGFNLIYLFRVTVTFASNSIS